MKVTQEEKQEEKQAAMGLGKSSRSNISHQPQKLNSLGKSEQATHTERGGLEPRH